MFNERKRTLFGIPTFTRYECDSEILHVHSGVLRVRDDEVRLYRIQDVARIQGPLQRLFGLHDIELHTTDRSMGCFRMRNVRDGKRVQQVLSQAVERARREVGVMEMGGRGHDHQEEVL